MYLAIARKWRPQRFDDLVGQEHVVQTLKNAIRLSRVSHAYLFSGARGVGKTSVARIFAKALRCPNAKDAIPCNECSECVAISESRSVDVVEIDGASNNGVESVRALRENVAYGASTGFYKIYIIDEVHMLSVSAFNALLKTLEEPPPHVIFLFATTEPQKIPLTILSRCLRFEFRRLNQSQLVGRLQKILKEENQNFSEEALRCLATHADGSLRDALSLLDQVLSYLAGERKAEGSVSEAEVVQALGISQTNHVTAWLSAVVDKKIPGLLKIIEEVYNSGIDLKHFAERCLEDVRLVYLIKIGKETKQEMTAEQLDISSAQFETLSKLCETLSLIQIERISQILIKCIGDLGWCSLPRYVLEMASVRMSELDGLDEAVEEVPAPAPISKEEKRAPAAIARPAPPASAAAAPNSSHQQSWKGFVDTVIKKRPLLGALLSHANFRLELSEGKKRVILSFSEGSFYEKQASEKRNKTEIDALLKQYFGPQAELCLSTDLSNTESSLEQKHQEEVAHMKQKAIEHPMVQKTKEKLGAEIVDVSVE